MDSFLQQVFNLLTTETGSLTYHLVLAFSIFGALEAALAYWRYNIPQCRRMVTGLGLLLFLRLALFAGSGLAWQGLVDPRVLLPPLDRAVNLLGLVIIIWLWAFPTRNRTADAATVLLGLVLLTLSAFRIAWSSENAGQISFSQSWLSIGSDVLSIVLILGGLVLLIRQRQNGWGTGSAMLFLLMLGPLAHLFIPSQGADFPGEIRLAQMAAYPLLLALPQRLAAFSLNMVQAPGGMKQDRLRFGGDPAAIQSMLKLHADASPNELSQAMTEAVARAMQADICLLLSPPDASDQLEIRSGYDLVREKPVHAVRMESGQVPVLAAAISRGKSLRLPSSSATPDLQVLQQTLNLTQLGNFLEVPIASPGSSAKDDQVVRSPETSALGGVVVITPYFNRTWTNEDEAYLSEIARHLAQLLLLNQRLSANPPAVPVQRVNPEPLQEIRKERDSLRSELEQMRSHVEEDRSHMITLAAMVAEHEILRRNFTALSAENERLKLSVEHSNGKYTDETNLIEGELRLALEEIAFLKDALQQADQKVLALQGSTQAGPISPDQMDLAANIAQELRQPLASIAGYSDFLLGESVGLLGAVQRKFLERMKTSVARMTRLVDDIVQLTARDARQPANQEAQVNLKDVVSDAVETVQDELDEKQIDLQVRIPGDLPRLNIARDILQKILVHLLQNASAVTPAAGGVMLQAQVERADGTPDYILIKVADSGGGIARENLPHVFSRLYRSEHLVIPGLADAGVGLGIVKTLVESQGGRVWVDTDLGRGTIFSVLLPIASVSQDLPIESSREAV